MTGGGTTGSTSPPALLGQGESSLQPSRAGEKNRKIGVELEKSPPWPPPAAGRGSRRRCRSRLDAAKGRHAAGRAPTRAGRDRAACCQQQAGPAPPPPPRLAQFVPVAGRRGEGRGGGDGQGSQRVLPLAPAGGGTKAHGPGAAWARGGSTPEKPTGEALGRRFGEKRAGFCPPGTSQPRAEPAARPAGTVAQGQGEAPPPPPRSEPPRSPLARSDTDTPQAGFLPFFFFFSFNGYKIKEKKETKQERR